MDKKNIAIEILPRALWVAMAICLFWGQRFNNLPPKLISNAILIYLGSSLAVMGVSFWLYVVYTMRKALFDKSLVTTGPFKYIRHPMYVGIYIMLLGTGILFFSKVWFTIMLFFIPIWHLVCKIEENQMIDRYGRKYLDYKKRAGMFLPKIF
jgi:protein-S-isoprenylcysteine O-methyltransferase Ste14